MLPHFDETCEAFLELTNHPKALIQLDKSLDTSVQRLLGIVGPTSEWGKWFLVESMLWASVSAALGHLWFMKETNINFVESEIVGALEWIWTDWSDQRLAATLTLTLTLKALALHAPTAFHSKTNVSTGSNEFLDHIGPVLSDIQPIVRVCAADAFSKCFTMFHNVSKSSSIEIRQEWQHSDAKCTFV